MIRKRNSGQALVEHVVLWPALILITMAAIQLGLLYRGRMTLEHATFMAAREGSINNAWKVPMKKMLAAAMAPLDIKANPNVGNYVIKAGIGSAPGLTYAENFVLPVASGGADIEVVSPSKAMFSQFAQNQYVLQACSSRSCPGGGSMSEARAQIKQIPNDNLSVRSSTTTAVGTGSNASTVNIQDANLLKIRSHWCFPLQVPVVNVAIYQTLSLLGGTTTETRSCRAKTIAHNIAFGYPIYYIPLSAGSIVRMQSPVRCEDASCSNLGAGGVVASAATGGATGSGAGVGTGGGNNTDGDAGTNTGNSIGGNANNSSGNYTGSNTGDSGGNTTDPGNDAGGDEQPTHPPCDV